MYGDMVLVTLVTSQRLTTDSPESRGAGQGIRKKGEPSFSSPFGHLGSLAGKWIQNQIIGHILHSSCMSTHRIDCTCLSCLLGGMLVRRKESDLMREGVCMYES